MTMQKRPKRSTKLVIDLEYVRALGWTEAAIIAVLIKKPTQAVNDEIILERLNHAISQEEYTRAMHNLATLGLIERWDTWDEAQKAAEQNRPFINRQKPND